MSDVEEEEEPKQAPAVVEKPECDVVTIEDSDDGQSKKKEKRREKESRPKKRKRSRYLNLCSGDIAICTLNFPLLWLTNINMYRKTFLKLVTSLI